MSKVYREPRQEWGNAGKSTVWGSWGTINLQGTVGLQQVPTLIASDVSEEKSLLLAVGLDSVCHQIVAQRVQITEPRRAISGFSRL